MDDFMQDAAIRKLEYQVKKLGESNAELWKELTETRDAYLHTRQLFDEVWKEHTHRYKGTNLEILQTMCESLRRDLDAITTRRIMPLA